MMNDLFPAIIALGFAYAFYKVVELYVRRRERMAIIEKMNVSDGAVIPPDITRWFAPPPVPPSWSLRLGLLFTGLGLGLALAVVIDYILDLRGEGEVMYFALMLFFGGMGLVVAYIMEQKNRKKD